MNRTLPLVALLALTFATTASAHPTEAAPGSSTANASASPAASPVPRSDERASLFRPRALSIAVNAGLIQPIVLGGANLEVDVRYGPFVAAYSHGFSLEVEGGAVVGEAKAQGVSLHLPYSTGFGLGVTRWVSALDSFFDLRLEGKIHRFEASYDSAGGLSKTAIASYATYTLGAGAYWTYLPFASRTDALRGIDVSTSVRFWPKVASTLAGDAVAYPNATTGKTETHRAANIGIADTPLIVNVSIGYVFQ